MNDLACAEPWCSRAAEVRGYCRSHYEIWRRTAEFVPLENEVISAVQLVRETDGLTYRMLDYWIRTGRITITNDAHGSGNARRITITNDAHGSGNARRFLPHEVAAIRDVVTRIRTLEAEMARTQSGEFYTERLAHHASHVSEAVA